MKQQIEQILGIEITNEQYKEIRSHYEIKKGTFIMTINDGITDLRKGLRINTSNWLDIIEHAKMIYPNGHIEGGAIFVE